VLPPTVEIGLHEPVREYWLRRVRQHTSDSYAGVPMSKFPEDLRVYEHLLWIVRPKVVIEIGTQYGGSALWFRDRLVALARYGGASNPRVISVDLDVAQAGAALEAADPEYAATITLLQGDVRDSSVPAAVKALFPAGARCFVVEDSAHTYETTSAALAGFSQLVPPEGFFVVEDGCVDVEEMRAEDEWPRGVLPAVRDWLGTEAGKNFTVRRDLELYGISCHPEGFLQRIAD
jgi:cephalosporin hydroxylase